MYYTSFCTHLSVSNYSFLFAMTPSYVTACVPRLIYTTKLSLYAYIHNFLWKHDSSVCPIVLT